MCKEIFDDFEKETAEEYFERGRNYVILEKYTEAIEDLTKVIKIFPHNEFYSEKLYIEAMQDFERASCFNGDSAETKNNLDICRQILFGYEDFAVPDAEAQKAFELFCDGEKIC